MAAKRQAVEAASLVVACRNGEATAWDELLDRFERLVYSVALREGLSIEDAADVTQTTFEALLAQLDRIRDDRQIVYWLMTVARRQAWRVRKDRQRLQPREQTTLDGAEEAEDPTDDRADVLWVYDGLSKLGSPCRDLITALYFDPHTPSYAEVASRLGRPVGSIGPTRARCLQRLRDILDESNQP